MKRKANEPSSAVLPFYDANGNISKYVSESGEVVAHYDYSPFGEPLVASGELAATFSHQFSTKPYCAVTGFSEYQMRKYRPEIGRWMSRDPLDESKYLAFAYIFSDNAPICDFDYLGLDSQNLGGSLLPGLTPEPTSPKPLDKPPDCGKPCPCGEGKDSTIPSTMVY